MFGQPHRPVSEDRVARYLAVLHLRGAGFHLRGPHVMRRLKDRLGTGAGSWGRQIAAADRGPLLLVLMAASIPVLLFAGWIAYRAAEQGRDDARVAAASTVERVTERVRAEMMVQIQVAQALALSATLDQPDLASFYREAERLRDARQLWFTVELDDTRGVQVMNLLRPLGAQLGATADLKSFAEAVRGRRPVVGGIGPVGPISGKKLVTVRVPVERGGVLRHILTVAFNPTAISSILRDAGIPDGWVGVVVDGTGNVIARNIAEDDTIGRPASLGLRGTSLETSSGRYTARSLEGVDLEVAFQAVPGIGRWSVHLGVPTARLETPIRRSLYALAGGIVMSLALAAGLASLVGHELNRQRIAESERATIALNASERQGALAVQAADLGTWRWDELSDRFTASQRCRDLMSLPDENAPESGLPSALASSAVSEEDRARLLRTIRAGPDLPDGFELEFRSHGRDRGTRWLRLRGRTATDQERSVIGVVADITEQKRAEADRMLLVQRLADAQEQIQARIARELHDQVGQTVTGLSLGLKSVERRIEHSAPADMSVDGEPERTQLLEQLRWLRSLANTLGREIHQAAADLRPTALDDLGLADALEAYAREWGRRFDIATDFQAIGFDNRRLASEKETAVYRVVQEALTNVVKHADARHVSIVLEARAQEVRLVIEDDGSGFDLASVTTAPSKRLGLSGMQERLAMIGATLRIESALGEGTSIFIRVPLSESEEGGSR